MSSQTRNIELVTTQHRNYLGVDGELCDDCRTRLVDEVDENLDLRVTVTNGYQRDIEILIPRGLSKTQRQELDHEIETALKLCAKGRHG